MKIGIIGQGFVGTAVREGLKQHYDIHTYDLKEKCTCESILELVDESDVIFVCVPTPMKKDGSCDISIVEGVIDEIEDVDISGKIVVIKSTVPPGTTERLNKKYKNISVVFNPEFLTEANFIDDFKNQDRIIIGGIRPASTKVRQLFYKAFPNAHIIKTSSTIAEMVKYTTNCFLSTKVSFANEMKQICDKIDVDYDKVIEYATYDERLGKSHWSVPGPDGHYGFGGSCFPKDINALIRFSNDLGLWFHTLMGAWHTNCDVRPEEDWKDLKGRAVVDE
jgi:UDPglucose 6-dehydrogenase